MCRACSEAGELDASLFARRALRAVERDRAIIIEPRIWRLAWYLDRLSPWVFDNVASKLLRLVERDLAARRSA